MAVHALETLGIRLMRAIADHLGEPADTFEAAVTGGDSILRLLHYPPAGFDGPAIRAGAHEDINAITCCWAPRGGLEILDRDGRWLAIDPPPGAVVVNIGDMLARLTNDVLPSTTHRVGQSRARAARRGRGSSTPVLPALPAAVRDRDPAGCVSASRPNRYPEPITAAAFLQQRLREIGLK